MQKKIIVFMIGVAAAWGLAVSEVRANTTNMALVNGFCGQGTVTDCAVCHVNNGGFGCDRTSEMLQGCTDPQKIFINDDASGNYCSFCPSDPACTGGTGCVIDAECDDGLFCNGVEVCVGGNCQAGAEPCGAGQACDEMNGCMAGPECTADADCDDGLFCNGDEICDGYGSCQPGADPCFSGESCDEVNGCTPAAMAPDGAALYADYCAGCHGADGRGGSVHEDVRGESGSEIREAIREKEEMGFLDFLTFEELQKIAVFLGSGMHDDDDSSDEAQECSDDDSSNDDCPDTDGDGMSDSYEGHDQDDDSSDDSDHDGVPDYLDPKVTHFPSDDGSGTMVLKTSHGKLVSCSTVNEWTSLPYEDKPDDVEFRWGFIDFSVSGLEPYGSVEVTLVLPDNLPDGARYWKYEHDRYFMVDGAAIQGREVTFRLTDDDGDGVVVDPGAVGVPATVGSSSGGGGGGCALSRPSRLSAGFDLGGGLVLLIPFLLRWRRRLSRA